MIVDSDQLCKDLAQFSASEQWYQHWSNVLIYTDGIKYLAEQAESHWLIDAIASYQISPSIKKRPDLIDFQLWILTVHDHQAQLQCYSDTPGVGELVIEQEIPYTDFPLSDIKLYVENGVLLLPSEH